MKLTKKEIVLQLNGLIEIAVNVPGSCDSIGSCVDVLRLHIKYLRFDLEATKRELMAFRKQQHG